MNAYESREESNKTCLLEAMEQLAGESEARSFIMCDDARKRLIGVHLMELFASDEQLPALELVARSDKDATVRTRALYTLALQKRTPSWELIMIGLLNAADETLRGAAIESLITQYTASARQALHERLSRETLAHLRAKLKAVTKAKRPRNRRASGL
jgi:hypothetical protein